MTTTLEERLRAAYAECRAISRRHYENFPTASRLVARDKRNALAAIYAFARAADDFADEPGQGAAEARLAGWRAHLGDCATKPLEEITHPVFLALSDSIRRYHLSQENFRNLLRAFEQDARTSHHPDFNSLLSYCSCSANPVGRLTLELHGYREEELFDLSDFICTALQLTNFWQDVAVDLERGRVYLPQEDLDRLGLSLSEIEAFRVSRQPVTDRRWRELMAFETARTAELFERGRPLTERVGSDLRRQLRLTWLGGARILAKIRDVNYDVFRQRPSLSGADFARLYLRSWRKSARIEAAAFTE